MMYMYTGEVAVGIKTVPKMASQQTSNTLYQASYTGRHPVSKHYTHTEWQNGVRFQQYTHAHTVSLTLPANQ